MAFVLGQRSPHYAADVHVEAAWDGRSLVESYSVRCQPESSRVGTVIIHLTQPRSTSLTWILDQQEVEPLSAHLLNIDQQRSMQLDKGETWEVRLPQPRSEPFTLRARRRIPQPTQPHTVALVKIPQAASQQGEVVVRATRRCRGHQPFPRPDRRGDATAASGPDH